MTKIKYCNTKIIQIKSPSISAFAFAINSFTTKQALSLSEDQHFDDDYDRIVTGTSTFRKIG